MSKLLPVGMSFDDVLLLPQHSSINSRSDIDIGVQLAPGMRLRLPILSANMETVTGARMASAMDDAGGLGILHRFETWDQQEEWMRSLHQEGKVYGLSVGLSGLGPRPPEQRPAILAIDVAHGDHQNVVSLLKDLSSVPSLIMAGNVATYEGAMRLIDAGADIIKVGVGPGSACTTRIETGHGVPQITAVQLARRAAEDSGREGILIVADGGIRAAGDIVKALAAGADMVMLGSLLAGTDESPGEVFQKDGRMYKHYRGSAFFAAKLSGGRSPEHIEGSEQTVPYKGPVSRILSHLEDGIRSGLSYSGAQTINELHAKAKFIRVGNARNVSK